MRLPTTCRSRARSPRIAGSFPVIDGTTATSCCIEHCRLRSVEDELRNVDVLEAIAERPCLEPRRVEDIGDEIGEPVRLVGDEREERLPLLGAQQPPPLLQRPRRADHGSHRAAQLVGDERDEVGAQRREPRELLDAAPLGLVRADVLDGRRHEAPEQRDELDLVLAERVGHRRARR